MPSNQFSHVCVACRTPSLVPPWRPTAAHVAVLFFAALAGAWVAYGVDRPRYFVLLGALAGFTVAFLSLYYLIRKRVKTCRSCQAESLIPCASPEGLRIMREIGFVES